MQYRHLVIFESHFGTKRVDNYYCYFLFVNQSKLSLSFCQISQKYIFLCAPQGFGDYFMGAMR